MRSAGNFAKREKCKKVLVSKPERNSPLGGPRCRWKFNIKTNAREVLYERVA
jgi:hypothetical protein